VALKSFLFKSCGKCAWNKFFHVDTTLQRAPADDDYESNNQMLWQTEGEDRTNLRSIRFKTEQERGNWNGEIKMLRRRTSGSKSSEGKRVKRRTSRALNHHPCVGFVFRKYTLTVWIMYIIAKERSKLWL